MSISIDDYSKFEQKKYVYAYFDVLGTKNSIKENRENFTFCLYQLNQIILRNKQDNIIYRSFTDNFFLAVETSESNKYEDLIIINTLVGIVYAECLLYSGLLLRGVISYGDLYIDENMVLGESFINAYNMESKEVFYPRIVLDIDSLNLEKEIFSENYDKNCFIDFDSKVCVNILHFKDKNEIMDVRNSLLGNTYNCVVKMKEQRDSSISAKLDWVRRYVVNYLAYIDLYPEFDKDGNMIK